MKKFLLFGLGCALLLTCRTGFGQVARPPVDQKVVPAGISWSDWEKMNDRWALFSTRMSILKNDGTLVDGQLIWMNDSILLVQKNFNLPNGLMNAEDYDRILVRDIASMKVLIGGHPYRGMITGMLAGAIPGFIAGLILAQGWTIIPAIVLGAVTAGGGGAAGSLIQQAGRRQTLEIKAGELSGPVSRRIRKSALFPADPVKLPSANRDARLPDFENLVNLSPTLKKVFPDNPWAISIHASILSNSVRRSLQNWYMSPVWGPADPYYESRIGLEADLSRRIGKRFQAGVLFQMFPGDISSSFFNSRNSPSGLFYSYTHLFRQTTGGIYGGWILQPAGRFWATRYEASVQIGAVLSDVYEHFYFNWTNSGGSLNGETLIRQHNLRPGAMMRLSSSWYLIPGFSFDTGIEGFLIRKVVFPERTLLPENSYGIDYIPRHNLNFSNLQAFIGFSWHF